MLIRVLELSWAALWNVLREIKIGAERLLFVFRCRRLQVIQIIDEVLFCLSCAFIVWTSQRLHLIKTGNVIRKHSFIALNAKEVGRVFVQMMSALRAEFVSAFVHILVLHWVFRILVIGDIHQFELYDNY
jgi:hypothetical protein